MQVKSIRPPIRLAEASLGEFTRGRSRITEALWVLIEWGLLTNRLQPSSKIRAAALRAFGAEIGAKVIIRPGVRIKFPWKLHLGNNSWIGEDVWLHNQDKLVIENDVIISQGTFVSTGSHAHRQNMDLQVAPVRIRQGAWVTARCIVLRGLEIGENSIVTPGSVVTRSLPADAIFGGNPARHIQGRW